MSSHARHGSTPRPADPHQGHPYPSSGYDHGYSEAAYGAPYATAGHADSAYAAYADAVYDSGVYDSGVYENGVYEDGGYAHRGYEQGGYAQGGYPDGAHGAADAHGSYPYGASGDGRGYAGGGYAEGGYVDRGYDDNRYASAGPANADAATAEGLAAERLTEGDRNAGGAASGEARPRSARPGGSYASAAAARQGGSGSRARGEGQGGSRTPRPTRAQARAAARARARRKRLMRTSFLGVGSVAAVAVIAVAGFMSPHHASGAASAQADTSAVPVAGRTGEGDASRSVDRATPAATVKQLPGLGAGFLAKVPANAQQVLLVTGKGKDQNTDTAVLWTRTAAGGWMAGPTWAARNAKDGWTTDHHAGDLHSPIGVFTLTDAGGLDANPGTKLPYTRSSAFQAPGTGFEGESLADAFDYVVAINYNHVPGTSPLDGQRPMGASRGGGIWIHVDHGGPTHGCVALAKNDMRALLQALDPAKHPVIVMGDAASLAQ